jgi:hypothetical protein
MKNFRIKNPEVLIPPERTNRNADVDAYLIAAGSAEVAPTN